MLKYYNLCEKQNVKVCLNYDDENFIPETYEARNLLSNINDIDVYSNKIDMNISDIIIILKKQLTHCKITEKCSKSYLNSQFLKNNHYQKISIQLPIGTSGNIDVSIDIIKSKDNTIFLGPYPNIIKHIFRDKNKYFFANKYENMPLYIEIELLNILKSMHKNKKTITTILSFSHVFEYNLKDDHILLMNILSYIKRLSTEIVNYTIDNLSITNIQYGSIKCLLWHENNTSTNEYIELSINSLYTTVRDNYHKYITLPLEDNIDAMNELDSEIMKYIEYFSYGKIPIINNKFIHICCDPIFVIDEYNYLLHKINYYY